jgi:hypothetical protein
LVQTEHAYKLTAKVDTIKMSTGLVNYSIIRWLQIVVFKKICLITGVSRYVKIAPVLMIRHRCVTVSIVAGSNEQHLLKHQYGNRLLLFRYNCYFWRRCVLLSTINCSRRWARFKLLPSSQRLILTTSPKRKVL